MIELANNDTEASVREMWKTVFEDEDDYIDLYFSRKYKNENTLIYFEKGLAVASLQMNPYTLSFYGKKVPFYYLVGLCTLPEYQKKGYMSQLISKAHEVMCERGIPLSILVPAEDWLFDYYERFGYVRVSDSTEKPLYPLKDILKQYPDMEDSYQAFVHHFQSQDFCIQKDYLDFETIVDEYNIDGCPDKYNLAAMAYIVDIEYLMSIYAKSNHDKSFIFKIGEERYKIVKGACEKTKAQAALFNTDVPSLCRMLFGYKTNELEPKYRALFPEHQLEVNFMLE